MLIVGVLGGLALLMWRALDELTAESVLLLTLAGVLLLSLPVGAFWLLGHAAGLPVGGLADPAVKLAVLAGGALVIYAVEVYALSRADRRTADSARPAATLRSRPLGPDTRAWPNATESDLQALPTPGTHIGRLPAQQRNPR
ncbi:hypothetical protein [Actinoplanes sp. L3-i22]|uniref:hypothetical protein n=1 Tax=Actinoplanes sp. L3-i22 TaxID=2836373 RepID=UPI001C850513|nr:hypothetical protein [Actinoplanes sp. L3-i22]